MTTTFLGRILLAALIVRVSVPLLAFALNGSLQSLHAVDTPSYMTGAESLIGSGTFSSNGKPELYRPPGYSLALIPGILLGHVELVTVCIQIVLGTGTVLLVYKLAAGLAADERSGRLAAYCYAMEPLSVLFGPQLMSETLFTFLLTLSLYLLVKYVREYQLAVLLASSLAMVACTYVRPVSQYLPWIIAPALVVWGMFRKSNCRRVFFHTVLFLVTTSALIGLWQLRNQRVAGFHGFSTVGVWALYCYHRPWIIANAEGRHLNTVLGGWNDDIKISVPIGPETIPARPYNLLETWPLESRYQQMRQEILQTLLEHPRLVIVDWMKRTALYLVSPGGIEILTVFGREVPRPVLEAAEGKSLIEKRMIYFSRVPLYFGSDLILGAWILLCIVLAGIGFCSGRLYASMAGIILTIVLLYISAVSQASLALYRLRHPIMPILCVWAGLGLSYVLTRVSSRDNQAPCLKKQDRA